MAVNGYRKLQDAPEQLKFTAADIDGIEQGFIKDADSIDMDLGDTNDFELQLSEEEWDRKKYNWGYRIFIPGTEYGGLLEECGTSTKDGTVTWRGYTWRGLLTQKIIQPPTGQKYLTVSGDANTIIQSIIGSRFGSLFVADVEQSGIQINNYQFDRYCTILSGLEKMLSTQNARLKIYYQQGTPGGAGGAVRIGAVRVTDWSSELECSQDGKLNFTARDYRRGINHLICAGEGEGEDRTILQLFVQEDGSIGDTQYYFGLDEREALYSYTSVESDEQLRKDGVERLMELMNYKQLDASLDDVDVDIGDIVGGRDRVTGMTLQKPVVNKILKIQDGKTSVEYKLKGED